MTLTKQAKDLQEGDEFVITTVQGRAVYAVAESVEFTPTGRVKILTNLSFAPLFFKPDHPLQVA